MEIHRAWLNAVAASVCVGIVQGCATLPDADKFVDASAQLRTAIVSSGTVAQKELEFAGETDSAKSLQAAWAVPGRTADAMLSYAESLSGIVKAGKEGAESVSKVVSAGEKLADAIGIAVKGVGAAVDLAAFIYKQAAAARASRALEQALEQMQPAADRIGEVMAKQLDDVEGILVNANQASDAKLRIGYSDETGYLLQLRRERKALYGISPLTDANAKRLVQIDEVERTVLAKLAPMEKEREVLAGRLKTGRQLVGAARQAMMDWPGAHRQLLNAVREGRQIDPQALLQTVGELRDLIKKARAQ